MNSNIKDLEKTLWAAADKMRGGVSVTNYKFLILGLIFLKYISDAFDERYNALTEEGLGLEEDRDAYAEENVFFVPENARWQYLVDHAKDYNIGEILDKALDSIEKENPTLKGVLFKVYNDPDNRNVNLGEIIDLFTNIKVGTKEAVEKDLLGRIYEYFLGEFAANELQKGGEFYTPACLVRTMVEIIEPYEGRVYDPACGSGGMFVQSLKFIQQHQGNIHNISIYGQEKNPTTWKLAKMNLAIRSIDGNLGKFAADTFTEDLHKDLKADFVMAIHHSIFQTGVKKNFSTIIAGSTVLRQRVTQIMLGLNIWYLSYLKMVKPRLSLQMALFPLAVKKQKFERNLSKPTS